MSHCSDITAKGKKGNCSTLLTLQLPSSCGFSRYGWAEGLHSQMPCPTDHPLGTITEPQPCQQPHRSQIRAMSLWQGLAGAQDPTLRTYFKHRGKAKQATSVLHLLLVQRRKCSITERQGPLAINYRGLTQHIAAALLTKQAAHQLLHYPRRYKQGVPPPQFCLLLYILSTPSKPSKLQPSHLQHFKVTFWGWIHLRFWFIQSCLKYVELNSNVLDLAKSHTAPYWSQEC